MMQTLDADLVVIGGGGAGLPAALTAIEGGVKRVVLLEKRRTLGGNASMAGGFIFAAESDRQKEVDGVLDRDVVFKQIMAFNHYDRVKPRILRAFVDKSGDTVKWLEDRGATYRFGHIDTMPTHILEGTNGPVGGFNRIIKLLGERFQKAGGQILLSTAGEQIVCDESGRIEKVIGKDRNGDTIEIHTKCVFLSCGGFTGNVELLKTYFPDYYSDVYWTDAVPNMGEGIEMARRAGASLAKHCTLVREPAYSFETKKSMPNRAGMVHSSLWVNARGERFADESIFIDDVTTNALIAQPGMVGFALFDADLIDHMVKNPQPVLGPDPVDIREVFDAEARTRKWCIKTDSYDEIAEWIGAEPHVLKQTVAEYNGFVERGHDGLFAKDPKYLVPLAKPPFYALKFRPLMVETVGPVEINERMEVLDTQGRTIPGFYAGGSITSGWQGNDYYLFGSALGWAINSGRIAGENVIIFLHGG